MIEIIRRRHRECCETISLTNWEPEGGQAHVDRADLIRIVDALASELAAERERVKTLHDDLREVAKAITNGAQDTLRMSDSIPDPTIVDFICNITGDDPQFIGSWERAALEQI